jgi:hypothetical protein
VFGYTGAETPTHNMERRKDYIGSTPDIPPFRKPASAKLWLLFQLNQRMDFGDNLYKKE